MWPGAPFLVEDRNKTQGLVWGPGLGRIHHSLDRPTQRPKGNWASTLFGAGPDEGQLRRCGLLGAQPQQHRE